MWPKRNNEEWYVPYVLTLILHFHMTITVLLCQTQAAIGGDKSNQNHNPLTVHSVPTSFNYYMFHQLPLIILLLFISIVILYKVISLLHLSLFIHHSCILSTHGSLVMWCPSCAGKGVFFTCFGMVWKRVNLTLRGNLWMLFGVKCFCPQEYILKTWTMMYGLISIN